MIWSRLFVPFILRDLLKHWPRTFITVSGITLGVGVFLSINLANQTALAKFCETVDLISGKANLELHSSTGQYVPLSYLNDLLWLDKLGVRMAPIIDETAVYGSQGGESVKLLGVDLLADPDFFSGGSPDHDGGNMWADDAALVGWRLAQAHGLKKGDRFDVCLNDKMKNFRVAGILKNEGLGGAFNGSVIVTDIENAQRALSAENKASAIEFIVPQNSLSQVKDELQHVLPPSVAIESPAARSANVEKMTRSFEYNLTALAFIALIVGMFLIYNTITISVVRRRSEIGTLRALGMSRWQIAVLFMLEALAFGIIGSLTGLLCGVAFADGALSAIAGTMEHFYFQHPLGSTTIEPGTVLTSLAIGVSITVLAAIIPVLESAAISPAEATRRGSFESRLLGSAGLLLAIGAALFICGGLAALAPPVYEFPFFGYLAALCAILGMAFSTPYLVRTFLAVLGRSRFITFLGGTEALLGARSLYGSNGRTSLAVASLMIGISMMISLAIMISSFRSTVVAWVDQILKADLWIQSAARARGSRQGRLQSSVLDTISQLPCVAAADGFVERRTTYGGEPCVVAGGDFDVLKRFGKIQLTSGKSTTDVIAAIANERNMSLQSPHSCLISESFSLRKNVFRGDTIQLPTNSSTILSLKVADVYYDYSTDLGLIVMDRPLFRKAFDDNSLTSIAVYLKPGENREEGRQAILNAVQGRSLIQIRDNGELRREAMRVFDRTFAVTYALHTIAVVVALLSVMNALLALSFESRRDYGILRYLGARKTQIRKIVLSQSLLLGCMGIATGLVVGFILSFLLVNVINKQSFGWTIRVQMPWDFIMQSILLILAAALGAGLLPAREAAKTLPTEVVRDE